MTGKGEPNSQSIKGAGAARADEVKLKGEKGQYNEILRPSEREDALIVADEEVENLPSQTPDNPRRAPPKRKQ